METKIAFAHFRNVLNVINDLELKLVKMEVAETFLSKK